MKRAALCAVLFLAAAIALAVRDGGEASARAAAAGAAARTLGTGTSRFTVSVEMAQPRPDSVPDLVGEGVMDYLHHRGRISYGHYSEQIFDGNSTYTTWPVPWHRPVRWLRVDSDSSDTEPFDLRERAMRNPTGLIEFLTAASDDVRDAGSDEVRGTPTTRIEGTIDLQKVVDQSPAHQRAELQDWLNFLGEDAPTTVPFRLWIDDAGVARRLRIDSEGVATATIEYYDFGVPVKVVTPPASSVITVQELMTELEAHVGDSSCGRSGGTICLERVVIAE
ncbi:MAG: LppX_LprAFG lipoprotein [Actinomycetota bacterium]|nr:LppX_LprAFG lipoprotein [Actinomycetota bacterium]